MASRLLYSYRIFCFALLAAAILVEAGCSSGGGGTGNDNAALNDNSGGGNDNSNANDNGSTNGNANDNSGGGNTNDNAMANANDNSGADNGNDNAGGTPPLEVIDTGLDAHVESPVAASDRLIAWVSNETGSFINRVYDVETGQDYDITANGTTLEDDFAAAGTDVIVRGLDMGVYHYDALNPEAAAAQVSPGVFLQRTDFGDMDTDGGHIIAFITQLPTWVCWVDLNDSSLFIRTFGVAAQNFNYFHVSVDGNRIAVIDGNSRIIVRDTTAAPPDFGVQEFTVTADTAWPIDFRDGYILYAAVTAGGSILHVIDTSTGQDFATDIVVAGDFRTRGGAFCALRNNSAQDSRGGVQTSAVGDADTRDYDTAPRLDTPGRADPGWGSTCALSTDGSIAFTAGAGDPAGLETDLLTRIAGGLDIDFTGNFTPAADDNPMLVAASNVSAGNGLIAMLLYTGLGQDAHIGYIRLDEDEGPGL